MAGSLASLGREYWSQPDAQEAGEHAASVEKGVFALVREHPWIPDDGDVPGV